MNVSTSSVHYGERYVDARLPDLPQIALQTVYVRSCALRLWLVVGELLMTREEQWYNAQTRSWSAFLREQRIAEADVLLYALRHGSTQLNEANKFRGWVDVPLDKNGEKDAAAAGVFLKDSGVKSIFCSDLERACETAKIVGDILNLDPTEDALLRPWNIGYLSGSNKEEHQAELEKFIDNPDMIIPDGESLNSFGKRTQNADDKYVALARKNGPILLVFHTSNIVQLQNYCSGSGYAERPESDEAVSPGGILCVKDVDGQLITDAIFKDAGKAAYGS